MSNYYYIYEELNYYFNAFPYEVNYVCLGRDPRNFFGGSQSCIQYEGQFISCSKPCYHLLHPNQATQLYQNSLNQPIISATLIGSYFFVLPPFSKVAFNFKSITGPFDIKFYVFDVYGDQGNSYGTKENKLITFSRYCEYYEDRFIHFNQTIFFTISATVKSSTRENALIGGSFSTSIITAINCPITNTLVPTISPSRKPSNSLIPSVGPSIGTSSIPTITWSPSSSTPSISPGQTSSPYTFSPTISSSISSIPSYKPSLSPSLKPPLPIRRSFPPQHRTNNQSNQNPPFPTMVPSVLSTVSPVVPPSMTGGITTLLIILITVLLSSLMIISFLTAAAFNWRRGRSFTAAVPSSAIPFTNAYNEFDVDAEATFDTSNPRYNSNNNNNNEGNTIGVTNLFTRTRRKIAVASVTDDPDLPLAEVVSERTVAEHPYAAVASLATANEVVPVPSAEIEMV